MTNDETTGAATSTEYEEALRRQVAEEQDAQERQPEIPHSSNADVVTLILGALMIIGLVICMTIYM